MRKVTILGGSGFIGTALCKQLAQASIPFHIIDLKESKCFPNLTTIGDIRDVEAMREHMDGNVVVNLAAVHRDDVSEIKAYYDTNVEGSRVVAQVSAEKGVKRIIFTSTVAVYGFAPIGTDELGEIKPFNHYGKSKFEAEEIYQRWHGACPESRQLIIVRPTVVFGEGNRGNVYNLLNQIASHRFVMVGDGCNKKSMAYVENVAAFIKDSILSDRRIGIFNYVDTPDLGMDELVRLARKRLFGKNNVGLRLPYWTGLTLGYIADALNRLPFVNLPISSIRVRKFCSNTAFSGTKVHRNGFVAPFSLEEGLERTLTAEFLNPDPDREIFYSE